MLTEEQFKVLAMLVEGREPFSMIYEELVAENREVSCKDTLAGCVAELCRSGFARCAFSDGKQSTLVPCVDQSVLAAHYDDLEAEMERTGGHGIYPKGEYLFEVTDEGRTEYDSDAYSAFW